MIIVTSAVQKGGTIKTRVFTGTDGRELAVKWLQELIAFLNQQGALTEVDLQCVRFFRPQDARPAEVWLENGGFINVQVEILTI
jgi:hypothetical protein